MGRISVSSEDGDFVRIYLYDGKEDKAPTVTFDIVDLDIAYRLARNITYAAIQIEEDRKRDSA